MGYARFKKKAGLIAAGEWLSNQAAPADHEKVKTGLMETVAHEIGHLGMGEGGQNSEQCLYHPRPWGILLESDLRGFPLRRPSDDRKRLMWWNGDRTGVVLIKDEWMKFRASKK